MRPPNCHLSRAHLQGPGYSSKLLATSSQLQLPSQSPCDPASIVLAGCFLDCGNAIRRQVGDIHDYGHAAGRIYESTSLPLSRLNAVARRPGSAAMIKIGKSAEGLTIYLARTSHTKKGKPKAPKKKKKKTHLCVCRFWLSFPHSSSLWAQKCLAKTCA